MKIALFVPAKGSSDRIKNKNLQILDGEYLFKRKLIQVLECREVDEVWLDSESELFHTLTNDLPIKHLYREPSLANNETDGHMLFENECKHTDADIVVQVLCTSPFIDANVIDNALRKFKETSKTSLVGTYEVKLYEWKNGRPEYGEQVPNSVSLPPRTIEAMGLYAVKTSNIPIRKRFTDEVMFYNLTPLQSVDINNLEDLKLAEHICAGMRIKKIQQMNVLSKILSSSLLSDICKEYKISHFLGQQIKSLTSGSFLGFAKTLKIKELEDNQKDPTKKDWEGIFHALKTYEFIVPGDVIIVSTDVPNKAYFGDLNATFAVRQGAVGVVIDGFTRDIERVSKIGLPVFAHGNTADDVRYEGTFEAMNVPIIINGITIKNNDIIFADYDGVICIPQEQWKFVLNEVKKNLKKEADVKFEATFGADPFDVLKNIGLF